MAAAIYLLCALTSLLCAVLLARGYVRTSARLLLWSSACFAALVVNNVLLFLDKIVVTEVDLSLARSATALAGLAILLLGLIWDAR